MRSLRPTASLLVVVALGTLLIACGSEVTMFAPAGAAGGTSPTTTSTSSGTGGSGGASTSTGGSGTAGAGGSGPELCGGKTGHSCGPDEFCDYPDDDCGADDGPGQCQPRPEGCYADCPGVCGCDGQPYCNDCTAHQAGVDVAASGTCASPPAEYSAQLWLGGLDHLIIFKADTVRNVCVRLFADWPMQNAPGFDFATPPEWGVSHADITNQASDCTDWQNPPAGDVVGATGGAGILHWEVPQGLWYPCELDIDAELTFPATAPWVPDVEPLQAAAAPIVGGCM